MVPSAGWSSLDIRQTVQGQTGPSGTVYGMLWITDSSNRFALTKNSRGRRMLAGDFAAAIAIAVVGVLALTSAAPAMQHGWAGGLVGGHVTSTSNSIMSIASSHYHTTTPPCLSLSQHRQHSSAMCSHLFACLSVRQHGLHGQHNSAACSHLFGYLSFSQYSQHSCAVCCHLLACLSFSWRDQAHILVVINAS